MKYNVNIQPFGKSAEIEAGTLLSEAAHEIGVPINMVCGGNGTCGKCRVKILEGECISNQLKQIVKKGEFTLACQSAVSADISIFIEHMRKSSNNILSDCKVKPQIELAPYTKKVFFELPPASRDDSLDDCSRLKEALGINDIDFEVIQTLPTFLRKHNWRGTAVITGSKLAAIDIGNTCSELYGVAVDIGSTTVVSVLYDLNSGEKINTVSAINQQMKFGDDVLSRISHARNSDTGMQELQNCITNQIKQLITQLCSEKNIKLSSIYDITIAGNATMQQSFLGIDVSPLGGRPFIQAFSDGIRVKAQKIGMKELLNANIFVFPQIASFIGGDTTAGIFAENLKNFSGSAIFIDIGTNGEIVYVENGKLALTSTAAGPAFEGASIKDGMRAAHGAIDKISYDGDIRFHTLGNTEHPVGLCGTAVIDCIAVLLNIGVIDSSGLMLSPEEASTTLTPSIKSRIHGEKGQRYFVIYNNTDGDIIALHQSDIREIQLGVGAIRSGINILLKKLNKTPESLDKIYIAGGFGNYMNISSAQRIGLIPKISLDKVEYIGNSSLNGASLMLLNCTKEKYLNITAKEAEHINLSMNMDFQTEFTKSMIFPT